MTKDDRTAFSLKIVSADAEAAGLDAAKASLLTQQATIQKLDTANKNLFDPSNALANAYQGELAQLSGIVRSTIVEQDILDAAAKKIRNHFFPNDTTAVVPSLSGLNNVWPRVQPFALTYGIGKNYVEVYPGTTATEASVISPITTLITSAGAFLDIENTSGEHVATSGTCSLPGFTDQATCVLNSGIWTAGPSSIVTYPAVVTLKTNLITAVNALKTFLTAEVALIPTTDTANQAQNQAAINNINSVILAALNAWLAQPDFNPVPGSVSPTQFPTYDPNLLAPTKLHSSQLATLQAALNARLAFITTRISQIGTVLGNIVQDVSTGNITSQTGIYGKRYGFLLLRLNALGGSLTQLNSLQTASGAQDSIKVNTLATKATYQTILPTSSLKSNASNSAMIHLIDTSFIAVGDTVYVYAEGQDELLRGVKAIAGDLVTLNDVIPAKYTTSIKARLYKDLS